MHEPPLTKAVAPTWLRWVAAVCVVLALTSFVCLEPGPLVLAVAGVVMPGWLPSAAFLVAGGISGWLGRVPRGLQQKGSSKRWISSAAAGWVLGGAGALTLSLVMLAVGYDAVFGVRHHVLMPAGPGGCQLVVAESSFTFSGGGTVYVLGARGVLGHRVGRYTTDDGARPVEAGSYQVTWSGPLVDLSFSDRGTSTYFDVMTCR